MRYMGPQYPMSSKGWRSFTMTWVTRGDRTLSSFLEDDNAIHLDGAVAARSNSASDISGMEKLGTKSELIVTYAIQSMNPYDPSWGGFMKNLASLYVLRGLKKERSNTPATDLSKSENLSWMKELANMNFQVEGQRIQWLNHSQIQCSCSGRSTKCCC